MEVHTEEKEDQINEDEKITILDILYNIIIISIVVSIVGIIIGAILYILALIPVDMWIRTNFFQLPANQQYTEYNLPHTIEYQLLWAVLLDPVCIGSFMFGFLTPWLLIGIGMIYYRFFHHPTIYICQECNTPFTNDQKGSTRSYCSSRCMRHHYLLGTDIGIFTLPQKSKSKKHDR